jgi:NTE family protein
VASLDVILGDNLRYNFDYYIDNGFYWSVGFRSRYNGFNRNIRTDFNGGTLLEQLNINSLNVDFTDFTNQAYMQTLFVQKFLIGVGLEYKYLKIKSATLQNTSPVFENSDYMSAFGYFKYDSFDNKYFPKKGGVFSADFQTYLYSTDYTNTFEPFSIAKGNFGYATTLFKKLTFRLDAEAGFSIGKRSIDFFDFILGGYGFSEINNIKPFYGYDFLSLSADSYIKSTFTLDYEIFKKNHLNFAANYANMGDNLFSDTEWISKPKYSGYAVGYGLETIIGPAEIKYTWSPELRKGFTWFSIGFWF